MISPMLIAACVAAGVSPQTTGAIIRYESAGNPLALHINGADAPIVRPRDSDELLAIAGRAITDGHSVDIGLMQVNVRRMADLTTYGRQLTDPCGNIKAGSEILRADYSAALLKGPGGQNALDRALSLYNTGDSSAGIQNGYVLKVRAATGATKAPAPVSAPINVYHRTTQ